MGREGVEIPKFKAVKVPYYMWRILMNIKIEEGGRNLYEIIEESLIATGRMKKEEIEQWK